MPARLASLLLAASAVLVLGAPPSAEAAWASTGIGLAVQKAMAMPTGTTPTSVTGMSLGAVGRAYTITWPTTWLQTGRPATGYVISRSSSTLGSALISGGSCAGMGTGGRYVPANTMTTNQSCTDDSTVALGNVRYSVTPVYGNWRGPASPWTQTYN
ncbi:hypothetical protein DQ239_16660 [Blastococcus sp. TF02-09]|uniref:hypothetical protein n=1 Tax=Blastococcus sp. TF02-09 TaxID=2250576 RepID=UPI000DE9785D|nr:hypothetical protein [Blastococcus sp. TF02-9]RBY75696.1 hypothetical protein DQ239_16660 [Blastococcus sp. TF02-9]